MDIKFEDLAIDTYRSSDGDHAVRITHLPTGTVAISTDQPTQLENRDAAMRMLKEALEN